MRPDYVSYFLAITCFAVLGCGRLVAFSSVSSFFIPSVVGLFFLGLGYSLGLDRKMKLARPSVCTPAVEESVVLMEVAMVTCRRCREPMPEDSIYCPHCGVKRTV